MVIQCDCCYGYSIMETAKANGLDPYHYLKQVFEKLPLSETESDIDAVAALEYRAGQRLIRR